ncbi:MAG: mechanosensitive ion channel domain-containing protein, partial [Pseudomonadota bacterium]
PYHVADLFLQAAPATDAPAAPETAPIDLRERAEGALLTARDWVVDEVFQIDTAIQFGVIVAASFAGVLLTPAVKNWLRLGAQRLPEKIAAQVNANAPPLVRPALWAISLWIAQTAMAGAGEPAYFVRIATSLATAWLIIRLATSFLAEGLRKPVAWFAWIIAALNAVGGLQPTIDWLNANGVPFGGRLITLPFIVQAILLSALFMYAAAWLSRQLQMRINTLPRVEPSLRILISNAVRIGLFFAAALLVMTSLQIPLSGLAILGGAIGVGLGFGMQQIVANFISGVILLTDRSIKPDDVIEVDDTYGVVKSLGLRYASVITRDGKEHLIPNEQLVTNKVVNWSYSNNEVRLKRRIRVEYETDLRLATRLATEGAASIERVLKDPAPKCLVMEFGDEAVELEVRFWVDDPQNGVNNVGSEVMLAVWDRFKDHGIDIPLRQEEILIQPGSTISVKMES